MRHKDQKPTSTSVIENHMKEVDDFVTPRDVSRSTEQSMNRVHAALHHLKLHKAADCIECEGKLWWFLTPDTDNRTRIVEMRAEEEPGTRKRRSKQQVQS